MLLVRRCGNKGMGEIGTVSPLIYPVPEVLNGSTQRRCGGSMAMAVTTSSLPPLPVMYASHVRLPDRMTEQANPGGRVGSAPKLIRAPA